MEGASVSPKESILHLYAPSCIRMAVLWVCSSLNRSWWYTRARLNLERCNGSSIKKICVDVLDDNLIMTTIITYHSQFTIQFLDKERTVQMVTRVSVTLLFWPPWRAASSVANALARRVRSRGETKIPFRAFSILWIWNVVSVAACLVVILWTGPRTIFQCLCAVIQLNYVCSFRFIGSWKDILDCTIHAM